MRTPLSVALLGGFTVRVDGAVAPQPWRLRKAKTIVKLLALAEGHRIHRDVLIEQLWPEVDPAVGANNLHQALHAARRVVGADNIVLHEEIVVLGGTGCVTIDVDDFEAAAERAAVTGGPDDLRQALALWSGELLPEDRYEDWATPHRDRLHALRTRLASDLARALIDAGSPDQALALLEPLAAEQPLDEGVHQSLLVALAATGRRWDAAAAYERLRDGLAESYGVAPTPETRAVYRRLFVGGAPDPATGPHNLPTLSTSLVGRQRELAELRRLLERTRLLTLTGPGGAGKTRLAVEVAHAQVASSRWADGVWLVELAGVTHVDDVPSAVGGALQLPLEGNRPWIPAIVDQLSNRAILLVLDNCEHVLRAVVPLVTELLARCPDIVIVATSREPLGHPAEIAWRVPSLALPSDDDGPDGLARLESVQLFVERAQHASPSFVLDGDTAAPVAEICRRLDGIPLALELAAVRVVHLSVAQLSARLGDALTILSTRGRGHPDRQQTLAATLDWSHDLLLDDERVAFRRLAVFAGGFDLEAAAAVAGIGDIVDVLGRLVDKSLVAAETTGEAARFRLLEVVRQYAAAHLREAGELAACVERHRSWYAREAADHDPDRGVPVVLEPPPWFDVEMDNLRVAFASAIDRQPCLALQLAGSTWRAQLSRGQLAEALGWLTGALQRCPDVSALRGRALFATAVLHLRRADADPVIGLARAITAEARSLGDDAAAIAVDQETILTLMSHDWAGARRRSRAAIGQRASQPAIAVVGTCHLAAILALARGEADAAGALVREAQVALDRVPDTSPPFFTTLTVSWIVDDRGVVPIPVAEETMLLGRRVGAAQARGHLAVAEALAERLGGRTDLALSLLDDALARFTTVGDAFGTGYALGQRGHALRWAGDLAPAAACFDAAEQVHRSLRDLRSIAMALAGRSYVAAQLGEATTARRQVRDAVAMMERSGDIAGVAHTLNIHGLVELELGDIDAALPPLERALLLPARVTPVYSIGWQHLLVAHLHGAQGHADASARAASEAAARFEALGDRRGQRALQRARKAGVVTMPS